MARKFTGIFNPCSEYRTHEHIRILHERLDYGLSHFSGMAQCVWEPNFQEILEKGNQEIKDVILDIISAFGFEVDENSLISLDGGIK